VVGERERGRKGLDGAEGATRAVAKAGKYPSTLWIVSKMSVLPSLTCGSIKLLMLSIKF
jgi:hypothetical protein